MVGLAFVGRLKSITRRCPGGRRIRGARAWDRGGLDRGLVGLFDLERHVGPGPDHLGEHAQEHLRRQRPLGAKDDLPARDRDVKLGPRDQLAVERHAAVVDAENREPPLPYDRRPGADPGDVQRQGGHPLHLGHRRQDRSQRQEDEIDQRQH
ncbi:MAG: hypothetical protein IH804_02950 [Planctomycetes bacterium]|nr:hypothetical protein [Planctomycetota bacterium]